MKLKFAFLAVLCISALLGARPMLRGFALGSVMSVDSRAGEVSVDLGSKDYAIKGLPFVIVDGKGSPVATVKAREVFDDRFWSEKLKPEEIASVRPGMQVRWQLTQETVALLAAKKSGKAADYARFLNRFPNSSFIPDTIKGIPDATMKDLNPDYYAARKRYSKEDFQEIEKKYKGTGFATAAAAEIASIDEFDKATASQQAERERRNAEADAERKRQEGILEKAGKAREKSSQEPLGKLVNNSTDTVRFVFKEPAELPQTTVSPNSFASVRLPVGSFSFDVFKVEDSALSTLGLSQEEPKPVKSGDVTVMGDLWEATYP